MQSQLVTWLDSKYYPTESRTWDNERFRKYLISRIKRSDHVLDLGAGIGRIPEMDLRDAAGHITGADLDPRVVDNPHLHEAVVLEPDAGLPFEDEKFDVVVTSNVLEHIPDPRGFLTEVRRVLRPGGLFISKTPNRTHYVAALATLTPHRFHEWVNKRRGRPEADTFPTFYKANTADAIHRIAQACDFTVVDVTRWEGPPNYLRILPPLYPVGILYERVVNATDVLAQFRAVLVVTLRKRGAS